MKVKRRFPIFNSHLDLAQMYWSQVILAGDFAIDATCGNGHDTLFLSRLCEGVIGLDLSEKAIQSTLALLTTHNRHNVSLYHQSHEAFPEVPFPIKLIVYNLGYLPGGDKGATTMTSSTLRSLSSALELVCDGGLISITCYPGHSEGALEERALLEYCQTLPQDSWNVCYHNLNNRKKAPSLLIIQKNHC